jgi:hypothetical protein
MDAAQSETHSGLKTERLNETSLTCLNLNPKKTFHAKRLKAEWTPGWRCENLKRWPMLKNRA